MDRRSFLASLVGSLGFVALPLPELSAAALVRRPRTPLAVALLNGLKIRQLKVALVDLGAIQKQENLFREDILSDCIVAEADVVMKTRSDLIGFESVTFPAITRNALCGVMVWAELSDGSQPVLLVHEQYACRPNGGDITVVGPRL